MKVLLPVIGGFDVRGEALFGAYLDYAQVVRPHAGKTFILAPIVGYRQFVGHGILNDFYIRAFPGSGYQAELSPRVYLNARFRLGILVYRQSHTAEERKFAPAPDVNRGFRF
jgi:hypothetical protein